MCSEKGFTLIEILIALFIFTILSVLMMSGLKTVINMQTGVERSADRLHELQVALLTMSNDVEQAVDRPIINAFNAIEKSFVGTTKGFALTRMGLANSKNMIRSNMQRVRYLGGGGLIRSTWEVLDQAPQSQPVSHALLKNVSEASFQYVSADGRIYNTWPVVEQPNQPLPRAIRVLLTISQWGKMSQLYVISAQASQIPLTQ
jgi:general secretion pathway protein J